MRSWVGESSVEIHRCDLSAELYVRVCLMVGDPSAMALCSLPRVCVCASTAAETSYVVSTCACRCVDYVLARMERQRGSFFSHQTLVSSQVFRDFKRTAHDMEREG